MKTRQEFNLAIADLVKEKYPGWTGLIDKEVLSLIDRYPDQRFGQIICNYVCPDYRHETPIFSTRKFMKDIFSINMDPFFEESSETYKRLFNS